MSTQLTKETLNKQIEKITKKINLEINYFIIVKKIVNNGKKYIKIIDEILNNSINTIINKI